MQNTIYFFIGTTAELIKLFPVIQEFQKKEHPTGVIASGQNDIFQSELWKIFMESSVPGMVKNNICLSREIEKKTSWRLLSWFIKTLIASYFILRKKIPKKTRSILLVHGDTVSTLMGAVLGKFLGFKIGHVEAGLRSFNFFKPFPEEITRMLVSKLVSIHFCPNEWALSNIKKGMKVNTGSNTLLDSLFWAQNLPSYIMVKKLSPHKQIKQKKYFIFVLHRQENLMNQQLVRALAQRVTQWSQKMHCCFILHEPTQKVLSDLGMLEKLEKIEEVSLLPRQSYLAFVNLLEKSEFIITDGGSNQEESYYLGKPCLILRKETERKEGLGENVLLSALSMNYIEEFIQNYSKYKRKPVIPAEKPSSIIVDTLIGYLTNL